MLPVEMRDKWELDQKRLLITSKMKVTNQDVADITQVATDLELAAGIYIYSGVHGIPGGLLQVDDPKFYEVDRELAGDGDGSKQDPSVKVFKMPLVTQAPKDLKQAVDDPNILVILAWCYSDKYI